MNDDEFDAFLVRAAFDQIARTGWSHLSIAGAVRAAGLDLQRARNRVPDRRAVLIRFGEFADRMALGETDMTTGPVQERLFDMMMRRIDALQTHREGVRALFRALPSDPFSAVFLGTASLMSMGWLLDAAGIDQSGPFGRLRAPALLAVWLWTVRVWNSDDSADLSATMAALDTALTRAAQLARSAPDHAAESGDPASINLPLIEQ